MSSRPLSFAYVSAGAVFGLVVALTLFVMSFSPTHISANVLNIGSDADVEAQAGADEFPYLLLENGQVVPRNQ